MDGWVRVRRWKRGVTVRDDALVDRLDAITGAVREAHPGLPVSREHVARVLLRTAAENDATIRQAFGLGRRPRAR